jgi:hypothetical protein
MIIIINSCNFFIETIKNNMLIKYAKLVTDKLMRKLYTKDLMIIRLFINDRNLL